MKKSKRFTNYIRGNVVWLATRQPHLSPLLHTPRGEGTVTGRTLYLRFPANCPPRFSSFPWGRLGWGNNTAYQTIFLLALLALTACNNAPRQQLAAGNQAFDQAAYDHAADSYQAALELDPDGAESIYNLANTRYRQGIYTDTHQLLPQAAALGTETLATQSHFNQGNAHYQLEDWLAAVEAYKETLRLNPQDVDAKYNLEIAMRNLAAQNQDQQNQENQNQEEQDQEEQEQEEQNQDEQNQDQRNQEEQSQDQQNQEEQNEEEQDQQNQEEQSQDQQNQEEQNEEQQNQNEQNQAAQDQPQEGEQQQQAQPSGEPQEGLTQEQALQLLRAVGQNTETLQEQMQQVLPAEGQPPEKDW